MPSVTPKFSVTFSVPEDEVDVTVNDRRALVCLAMAAFADASTELVVSARADGRADGINPQQVKITSAVVASVRGRPKRRALELWTEPTPTNLTAARGLAPIGHEADTAGRLLRRAESTRRHCHSARRVLVWIRV
jgi:hypothetical protein